MHKKYLMLVTLIMILVLVNKLPGVQCTSKVDLTVPTAIPETSRINANLGGEAVQGDM